MAVEPGDVEFQSKMNERSRKRARDELNELNDKDRELAVQALRQWVLEQKWLRTPTDFEFLLKFLRARKFSQLLARVTLENYWTAKTKMPEWFRNIDPSHPTILEILRAGIVYSPKAYDKEGRRLYVLAIGKVDADVLKKKWGLNNVFKAMCLVLDWMNWDENVQVNGLLVLIDDTDVTTNHSMTLWNNETIKGMTQFFENCMPSRMKGIHVYNQPPFANVLLAMFHPFMKQKMRDRIFLHGRSMVNVYPHIGHGMLPKEYLPDECKDNTVGDCCSVVEEMIADMNSPEFRSYIEIMSGDKYGVDLSEKDKDAPVASFRKLNVD